MARPRKNDPRPLIRPLVADFVSQLSAAVERATYDRVLRVLSDGVQPGQLLRTARRREAALCYYPGCKNLAAPRFGMFCAALHKDLPRAQKDKLRTQHAR
jgi:hypothetical protein